MKLTLIPFVCAVMLIAATGCVTDNGKFPTPDANFTPKRAYVVSHDKLWQATLDTLDKNRIAVVNSDKADGIIQTDYLAGPGEFMVFATQITRYKYNITLRDESNGSVKLNIICAIEDSMNDGKNSTQWRDVTPQNTALAAKLEAWLYEQVEQALKG
ncbi:MAG TPA: hypothetical protein VH280_10875 [Verrucomicrobiae bacterium]|jgi:hypothetical protein|nr:hypothetical protein [Verrucomicrobiae bacterium]